MTCWPLLRFEGLNCPVKCKDQSSILFCAFYKPLITQSDSLKPYHRISLLRLLTKLFFISVRMSSWSLLGRVAKPLVPSTRSKCFVIHLKKKRTQKISTLSNLGQPWRDLRGASLKQEGGSPAEVLWQTTVLISVVKWPVNLLFKLCPEIQEINVIERLPPRDIYNHP